MAHFITLVGAKKCTLLEHGKKSVWLWSQGFTSDEMYLNRGNESREYRLVEKINDHQYRATLEDAVVFDTAKVKG